MKTNKQFQYVEGMDLQGAEVKQGNRAMRRAAQFGLAAGSAIAATSGWCVIDTTAVTAAITDAATAIATVGAAVLVAMVGVKVYKWIKAAL